MYPTSSYPLRPSSPYNPPQAQGTPTIEPGTITYTTSVGPDGRAVYHPFKAVPASYQTPTGVVHGIQWVPAEATQILPAGAQPATADFAASWERTGYKFDDPKYSKDWQREDEKRRKKKEKEEAKARERGRSFAGAPPVAFPSPNPSGYPTSPYIGSTPSHAGRTPHATDLDRQFNSLDISGRPRKYSTSEAGAPGIGGAYPPYGAVPGPYSKPYPAAGPHISAYSNPSPNMRAADVPPASQAGYPASPYISTGKHTEPIGRVPSPHPPATSAYGYPQPPRSRATTPIPGSVPTATYAQPRSRATSPVPGYAPPRSRAASPMPGGMPLPPEMAYTDRSLQPTVPESFSRAVNKGTFPPFDPIKLQEMDEFLDHLPKLPLVLQSHDVNHHDWIRMGQDMSLAWGGKMPIPPERAANPPKRSNIVAELLHAWNTAFFLPRGVEVVLYKGSVRFSGSKAGIADLPLKHDGVDSDEDSSTSSESDSGDEPYHPQPVGLYGSGYPTPMSTSGYASEASDARRRHREEKKRRRKEKRMKRKQREREKKYNLYVTYVPVGMQSGMPGRYPASRPGGY